MPLVKSPIDFLFGLPLEFLLYDNITYFIIVISFTMLIMSWVSLKHKKRICHFQNQFLFSFNLPKYSRLLFIYVGLFIVEM
jgi:uncharacterized membrane protein YvlD (DUF360 family)